MSCGDTAKHVAEDVAQQNTRKGPKGPRYSAVRNLNPNEVGGYIQDLAGNYVDEKLLDMCYDISANDEICEIIEELYYQPSVDAVMFDMGQAIGNEQGRILDLEPDSTAWDLAKAVWKKVRGSVKSETRSEGVRMLLRDATSWSGEYEDYS